MEFIHQITGFHILLTTYKVWQKLPGVFANWPDFACSQRPPRPLHADVLETRANTAFVMQKLWYDPMASKDGTRFIYPTTRRHSQYYTAPRAISFFRVQ